MDNVTASEKSSLTSFCLGVKWNLNFKAYNDQMRSLIMCFKDRWRRIFGDVYDDESVLCDQSFTMYIL